MFWASSTGAWQDCMFRLKLPAQRNHLSPIYLISCQSCTGVELPFLTGSAGTRYFIKHADHAGFTSQCETALLHTHTHKYRNCKKKTGDFLSIGYICYSCQKATVMMDDLRFTLANRSRIHAVESSFGPAGKSLFVPGRVLVGEGRLTKLCRRRPQPKVFFLFNDILVYGSIVVPGRWNNNQKIIRLVEVHQEDLLDGVGMTNQWLLRTPRKSFHVSAASSEEKQAWMQHIEQCRVQQLQNLGVPAKGPSMDDFAAIWIPDNASAVCMRCTDRFHVTNRRHHCRHCGFVVCGSCSKSRAVLRHISSKPVRVCWVCKASMQEDADKQQKQSWKCNSMEDTPEYETSSDEEEDDDNHVSNHWFSTEAEGLATYCYLNPSHTKPPLSLRRAGQGTCRLNPAHTSTTVLTLPTSVHCVHSPGGTFQRL